MPAPLGTSLTGYCWSDLSYCSFKLYENHGCFPAWNPTITALAVLTGWTASLMLEALSQKICSDSSDAIVLGTRYDKVKGTLEHSS